MSLSCGSEPARDIKDRGIKYSDSLIGFHRAFVDDNLRLAYNHNATLEPVDELRGIRHGSGAIVSKTHASSEDNYENLAKAIAIYNSNGYGSVPFFTAQSWPRLLRYKKKDTSKQANSATICHSCYYSIHIRDDNDVLKGRLRDYIWYGGEGVDVNKDGYIGDNPNTAGTVEGAGEEQASWCFVYGENEWINGKEFDDVKGLADSYDEEGDVKVQSGAINCQTGVAL